MTDLRATPTERQLSEKNPSTPASLATIWNRFCDDPCLTSGPTLVTLRSCKGALPALNSGRRRGGQKQSRISRGDMTESPPARLRLGMVGGGRGALIGETHRIAARLDDR